MKSLAKFLAICAAIVIGGYAACALIAPTYRVRYRLTLDVDVNGVMHRGSGVVGVSYQLLPEDFTGGPVFGQVEGYAITVDLGERGVLFVINDPPLLISHQTFLFHPIVSMASLPLVAYGLPGIGTSSRMGPVLEKLLKRSGHAIVRLVDLPMLVHFRDAKDPGPAYEVNPLDLAKSFGEGRRISRATLELTRDRITPMPQGWPSWLANGQNLQFTLRTDDDSLSVPVSSEISTYEFKGE